MSLLKYKSFIGSIEYDEPDNVLHGRVLGLNRVLISYEGESIEDLKKDFIAGIDHYLQDCKEKGEQPQKSYTGSFNVRITSEMHSMAVQIAKIEGITLNAFVKGAIEDKIRSIESKRKRGSQREKV